MTQQKRSPLVSIIIDNYNYARYVASAIDSALRQTWQSTEVIVVDDGSTDESPEIIARYAGRVHTVLKPNGGQASAFNAGFAASSGDIIIFLDSDDTLLETASAGAVAGLADPHAARLYWHMPIIDATGRLTGATWSPNLVEGDLAASVLSGGPYMYRWAPTSGNAWRRSFLDAVLPIPEVPFLNACDNYLSALAPLYGTMKRSEPLSCYRRHDANATTVDPRSSPFMEQLATWLARFEACLVATEQHAARLGYPFSAAEWTRNSWFHRITRAVKAILEIVPDGAPFVLIDEDHWQTGGWIAGRRAHHFVERDGVYWGRPRDDVMAVQELELRVEEGTRFLAVDWNCRWWLDAYPGMREWIQDHCQLLIATDDVEVFALQPQPTSARRAEVGAASAFGSAK